MEEKFLQTERVYTISELNSVVRNLLREEFSDYIWVCGEIQDLRERKDKPHIYFKLVQKHPELDEIIAQIKAIIFEEAKKKIFLRMREASPQFELKNNIEVKVLCKVEFYAKRGEIRLFVFDIDPFYTLGKLAQAKARIIENLKRKGLLEKNKQLEFPLLPLRIGLITSFDSAAYHDFINELKVSNYGFKIFLYNSYMQGKFVEQDVIKAIDFFNQSSSVDIIVITRGGGSTADLSWFDNEKIAETIANSSIPVLSALGHQINTTVCDLVAHTSLKTPTKVAQFLVEKIENFKNEVEYLGEQIMDKAKFYLERENKDLKAKAVRFDSLISHYFLTHHTQLTEIEERCLSSTRYILASTKNEVRQIKRLLNIHLDNFFKKVYNLVDSLQTKLKLLDPKNILKRGYSITFKGKKAVKNASLLKEKDKVRTVFFKGEIEAEVKRINEEGD